MIAFLAERYVMRTRTDYMSTWQFYFCAIFFRTYTDEKM